MTSKILGPPVGYVDILNHETYQHELDMEAALAEGAQPSYNPLRPSSSGRCTRELAYALMEFTQQKYYPKDAKEPEVVRLLSVGHAIEPDLIKHFNKYCSEYFKVKHSQQHVYGFEVQSEEIDELNHLVQGSLDSCFFSQETRGIIDYKTKKDKFHRFFRSDWDATTDKLANMETVVKIDDSNEAFWVADLLPFLDELKDPFFEANFWQLNFYANTDWAKKMEIDHGAIIQYNKNDSRVREIRFALSPELYNLTFKKFQAATDAASKGRPQDAPRDHMFGSIKCAFCAYKGDCWKEEKKDAKQAFFNTNFRKKRWPKDTEKMAKGLASELEELYGNFKEAEQVIKERKETEEQILKIMLEQGFKKIRFEDGHVYEAKFLKSPREHYELRRTKL